MPCWIPDPNGGESTREKSENVTVETTVNGDVSVTSGTQTATGVSVNTDFCTEGSVDLTVDGKVTAVSTEEAARGVSVFAQDSRDIHLKVTVTGEVNATGETFAFGVTNEENRDHPGIGVTTEINVLGGVNASAGDWACGIRSEGSKDSRTEIYAEGAVNAEANQATGMLVTGSREETGGYAQVVVNGEITATGTGEGSVAEGVYIEGNQDFNARIETGGGIRAEAEETAFGIDIATRENAEVNMVADGSVDAVAYGLARGVYVYSENEDSTANLTVWGDVTAESKGGERGDDSEELRSEGIDIDSRNSSMTVTINGNVKAVGEWGVGADLSTDYQTEYVDLGNYTGTYNEKDYTETEVWDNKETGEHFEITDELKALVTIMKLNGDTNGKIQKQLQVKYLCARLKYDREKYELVNPSEDDKKNIDSHYRICIGNKEKNLGIIAAVCVDTNLYISCCKKLKPNHKEDWKGETWAYLRPEKYPKKRAYRLNDCENILNEKYGDIKLEEYLEDIDDSE